MRVEVEKIINGIIDLATNSLEQYHLKTGENYKLEHEVLELVKEFRLEFVINQQEKDPEQRLLIDFGEYSQDVFHIKYEYHVTFSKLAKVWKDVYYSKINHPNPENASNGVIYATDCSALTKTQYEFGNRLTEILEQFQYLKLEGRDLIEVNSDLEFPAESLKFFGPQPTVEMVLFKPLWGD